MYEYFNKDNGNIYAVKELNIEILNKKIDNINSVIKNEIDLLSKMNHINIVKYYGSFVKGIKLNIVLEYCRDGSLLTALKKFKKFDDETLIRKYVSQILDGLEYLHIHNIIHRDIKCANILLDKGTCKLTDFGGAKIIKNDINSLSSSFIGTLNWTAPEIILNSKASRFSDIWSIGCTILEMYQGEPPYYDKKDPINVYKSIGKKELPKIPEGMSEQLKDFVKKCLVFEPIKRYNVYQLKKHPFLQEDNSNNSISSSNASSTINSFR